MRADYDACLQALSGRRSTTFDDDLLFARSLVRARRLSEVDAFVEQSRLAGTATGLAERASAATRDGKTDLAKRLLEDAFQIIASHDERALVIYERAFAAWSAGHTDAAESILDTHDFVDAYRPQALELRGWICVRRSQYREAIDHFLSAYRGASGDAWTQAYALLGAAVLARDVYAPEVMTAVRARALIDSRYLAFPRLHIERCSAWFNALRDDLPEALDDLHRAERIDCGSASRIAVLCDRSYLSLAFGERANGWRVADDALEIAQETDWARTYGDERMGLLYLASLLADRKTTDARRLIGIYRDLKPAPVTPTEEWWRDARSTAWESYAEGVVLRAEGHGSEAAKALGAAFSIYNRIGFKWRAVLAMLARISVSRVVPEYVDYARIVLEQYPNSWLRSLVEHEMRRVEGPALAAKLTPMQRQVLEGVIDGLSNKEIAQTLGRTPSTVRDHLTEIFRRTGSRNRADLVRRCTQPDIA